VNPDQAMMKARRKLVSVIGPVLDPVIGIT